MFSKIIKITFVLFLIIFTTSFAQNYNDAIRVGFPGLGSNARALGMGNAFNALSDDASAAYFNPAGFGLLKKLELSGGLSITSFDNNTTFFGKQSQDNTTNTSFNRISFAFPFPTYQGSLVFGLSYYKSKDLASIVKFDGFNFNNNSKIQSLLGTDIPYELFLTDNSNNTIINGDLNQSGDILNSGGINNWTFSGAIEVQKNFFIGGNLTIASGSFNHNSNYYEDDTRNVYQGETAPGEPQTTDFQTFYFNNIVKWDISGWNAKIGFLYQLEDVARFGATVQFPKTFTIDENYSELAQSFFAAAATPYEYTYSDKVKYDIKTPFELTAATAVNFKGLILSGELTYIDYSELEFSNAQAFSDPERFISDANKGIKDNLTSVVNYNLGLEYTVPMVGLRLRGGFIMQPSAFKGDPSDYDHKYFTAGIGYLANGNIGIDAAYAYGWWKDIGDNYDSGVSRTYQSIKSHTVMLTTTFRF
jgi:long-subunit fatty acid transport protein